MCGSFSTAANSVSYFLGHGHNSADQVYCLSEHRSGFSFVSCYELSSVTGISVILLMDYQIQFDPCLPIGELKFLY